VGDILKERMNLDKCTCKIGMDGHKTGTCRYCRDRKDLARYNAAFSHGIGVCHTNHTMILRTQHQYGGYSE
jgi:hypothetical protein